jgi:hypothetical protein
MPTFDAILIPGGGVRQAGQLPPWVRSRFDLAIARHTGGYLIALSAGTTHRPPPLDASGFPILESVAGARYLVERGVPADRILTETHSYDTVGNAWFSRVIHAQPLALRRLLVVTSHFHLARTRAVFEWVYSLEPRAVPFELAFEGSPDTGMDAEVLAGRTARERRGLDAIAQVARGIAGVREFHRWLFGEHAAYCASASAFRQAPAGDCTLESY